MRGEGLHILIMKVFVAWWSQGDLIFLRPVCALTINPDDLTVKLVLSQLINNSSVWNKEKNVLSLLQ